MKCVPMKSSCLGVLKKDAEDSLRTSPRKRESGAAVTVVVHDDAAIAQRFFFHANAAITHRAEADFHGARRMIREVDHFAAALANAGSVVSIGIEGNAFGAGAAEDAVGRARDDVGEIVFAHERE